MVRHAELVIMVSVDTSLWQIFYLNLKYLILWKIKKYRCLIMFLQTWLSKTVKYLIIKKRFIDNLNINQKLCKWLFGEQQIFGCLFSPLEWLTPDTSFLSESFSLKKSFAMLTYSFFSYHFIIYIVLSASHIHDICHQKWIVILF